MGTWGGVLNTMIATTTLTRRGGSQSWKHVTISSLNTKQKTMPGSNPQDSDLISLGWGVGRGKLLNHIKLPRGILIRSQGQQPLMYT